MADLPLTKQDEKFVFWFLKYRDVYKAAERASIPKNRAKRTYDRIEIQEEIERQQSVVERERARVQVEAEGITKAMLDVELMQLIMLDSKKYSAAKLRGIELGYVRAGVLQVGNTKSLDLMPSGDDETPLPTVYQALIRVGASVDVTPILPESAKDHAVSVTPQPVALPSPAAPIIPVATPRMENRGPIKAGRIKLG